MKKTILIALVLVVACSKNSSQHSITVPDIVQAANKRGNISGRIQLFDADGNAVAERSGITVSIDNSSVNTHTAADGSWTLDSIPYGVYDISYTKTGYGSGKLMGVNHEAINHATTNIKQSLLMNAVSALEISSVTVTAFDTNPQFAQLINSGLASNGVHIVPVFSNAGGKIKKVRMFFSDQEGVSSENYLATEKLQFTGTADQSVNSGFELGWFISNGFKAVQTVFVKVYGDGFANDHYDNPLTGFTIFPSLSAGSSKTVSFILPSK